MNIEEILTFIEDREFDITDNWFLHATSNDIGVIEKIFEEGIKSAYLRDKKPNHFNGRYYISLYKYNALGDGLSLWLDKYPKFVIDGIDPLYADRKKLYFRRMFINTRLPLRTSEWDGEYQQYLMIDKSKFIAFGYDLSYILKDMYCSDETIKIRLQREKLLLLKNIIMCMHEVNNPLPIYDFSTKREINKEKVLSLHI